MPRSNVEAARRLRREDATEAEKRLWRSLRAGQLGAKFRRQHMLGRFILDFVCLERGLVIELDGGQHAAPEEAARDARRTAWLAARGLTVLRFWNNEVFDNLDGVLTMVAARLSALPPRFHRLRPDPHPGPLPQAGEGEKESLSRKREREGPAEREGEGFTWSST